VVSFFSPAPAVIRFDRCLVRQLGGWGCHDGVLLLAGLQALAYRFYALPAAALDTVPLTDESSSSSSSSSEGKEWEWCGCGVAQEYADEVADR
jgi:hypothetical protein